MANKAKQPYPKTQPSPSSLPASLTKHQSFRYEEIDRSRITSAPYNPRTISDYNRKQLTESLKQKGLVMPLVWNERTGNLVGGHQRLEIIDKLERTGSYKIGVAAVDLTETEEKELNISLNSPNLMGFYDPDKLFSVLETPHLDLDAIGFSMRDLEMEIGSLPQSLLDIYRPDEEDASADGKDSAPPPNPPASVLDNPPVPESIPRGNGGGRGGDTGDGADRPDKYSVEGMKQRKKEYVEGDRKSASSEVDYSLQLVFASNADRELFLSHNRLRPQSRFLTVDEIIPILREDALWRVL